MTSYQLSCKEYDKRVLAQRLVETFITMGYPINKALEMAHTRVELFSQR